MVVFFSWGLLEHHSLWKPVSLKVDEQPEEAAAEVDVQDEEEDEFRQLHAGFDVLVNVEVRYDFVEPEHPTELQNTQDLD